MSILGRNYRAWDLKELVMRAVNDICFLTGSIKCEPLEGHDRMWEMYDPICFKGGYILMQQTGVKSFDGVEIFRKDIVFLDEGEDSYIGVVEWDSWGYYIKGIDPNDNFSFADITDKDVCELKILGNIYENPELLVV